MKVNEGQRERENHEGQREMEGGGEKRGLIEAGRVFSFVFLFLFFLFLTKVGLMFTQSRAGAHRKQGFCFIQIGPQAHEPRDHILK